MTAVSKPSPRPGLIRAHSEEPRGIDRLSLNAATLHAWIPGGWSKPSSVQMSERVLNAVINRLLPSADRLARSAGFCGVVNRASGSTVRIVATAPLLTSIDAAVRRSARTAST